MKTIKQPAEVLFKSLDFADKIVMLPIIDRFANAIRTNCDISIMELNSHDNRTTEITIDNAKKMFKILSDLGCRTSLGESYEDIVKSDNSQQNTCILFLRHRGDNPLNVTKLIKETLNLGLKEAKDLVDSYPTKIDLSKYSTSIKPEEYKNFAKMLEEKGAIVTLEQKSNKY